MPSQQPIISTSTLVDCCIIHLTSLHFPWHWSTYTVWAILGCWCCLDITFIYPTNCINVNIELYRVSIHNHRKTTGSNVLPTESFIPSHTHIHSSCCYYGRLLVNHVHWHHPPPWFAFSRITTTSPSPICNIYRNQMLWGHQTIVILHLSLIFNVKNDAVLYDSFGGRMRMTLFLPCSWHT